MHNLRNLKVLMAIGAVAALVGAHAADAAYKRTKEPALAAFHGIGPAGFKIDGTTTDLDVKQDDKNLSIVIGLKELTTGISLRDNHMREKYLQVDKFPETRLDVPVASLKFPAAGGSANVDLKGNLTLHGVTKELPFHVNATCDAKNVCKVKGTIALNMNDFGIVIPTYLGVTMKPDVTIETSFEAQDEAAAK
jgi:polyisoprenoid-binding protein YceI